jgi:DMSO/TMAO reductase YedYZ molybdopterin-dependent catalytic subunit
MMDRRRFLNSFGPALLLSAGLVRGERHVVSVNPLEVESDLTSLEGRYTALEDFYVRNHHVTPQQSARPLLRVEGEVGKPMRLTPADLTSRKKFELGAVLECAGNPSTPNGLVSNGMWGGWSLSEIIQLARPSRSAAFLHLFGRDGYVRSVPMDRVQDGAMLVTNLGPRPLQPDHGAPWRAFFPGWYGMDSVKWLDRIVVSVAPLAGPENEYVEMRLGAPVGIVRRPLPRVQVKSVITSPTDRSVVPRGSIEIRGLAWSGEGSISKVQLTADEGTNFHDADLSPGSRYEWVLWRASLELSRLGATELVCRATDSNGHTQPERRAAERLDGYGQNWYHRVQVAVV